MPASDIPSEMTFRCDLVTLAKDGDGVRRFDMLAYSGARVKRMFGDMILNLDGVVLGRKKKPILLNHETDRIAGYSESVSVDKDGVHASGRLSSATESGREIAATADEGFPWEASVGITIESLSHMEQGESREINGRMQKGPLTVAEKFEIREISFVPNGADKRTSASVFNDSGKGAAKPREAEMPETLKVDPIAAFQKDHGETIEKWKSEATAAAVASERERFKTLFEAFADRPKFVCEQFAAGSDVAVARGALSGVLAVELKDSQTKIVEMQTKLAEAEKKAANATGHDGVTFTGEAQGTDGSVKLTIEQQARNDWKADKDGCTSDFASVAGYERYLQEEARIEADKAAN